MPLNPEFLSILACPVTHGHLEENEHDGCLVTGDGRLRYALSNADIPMLVEQARANPVATKHSNTPESFAARYDALIEGEAAHCLYGDSGFFNVGYWLPGCVDLPAACRRLAIELASLAPETVTIAVDVGCGLGAGTLQLKESLGAGALVVGINISERQARFARASGVPEVAVMDATALGFLNDSVDFIVTLESALHFSSRQRFFQEAARVLRPNGVIAIADQLYVEPSPLGAWLLPETQQITTLSEYQAMVESCGLQMDFVRDCTEHTWAPYCDHLRRTFPQRKDRFLPKQASTSSYLIARAFKPNQNR